MKSNFYVLDRPRSLDFPEGGSTNGKKSIVAKFNGFFDYPRRSRYVQLIYELDSKSAGLAGNKIDCRGIPLNLNVADDDYVESILWCIRTYVA